MHSYRFGEFKTPVAAGADNSHWYEFLGIQSTAHGPKEPIAITFTAKDSPLVKGFADWTTIKEELYNNVQILTAKELAKGKQKTKGKDGVEKESETVVVWTNEFGPKKTRVFSTTIGHENATVEDPRYLDLVTRGVLWSAGKLNEDGTPAQGYGPGGK
jgi:type 1 glutamine amidotransferase